MTEWGIKVTTFRARYGLSLKELCDRVGVAPSTISAVLIGRTAGIEAVAKIDKFIADMEATQAPPQPLPFAQSANSL
jgi:transcriptional regulator with XRE-family HTH domain